MDAGAGAVINVHDSSGSPVAGSRHRSHKRTERERRATRGLDEVGLLEVGAQLHPFVVAIRRDRARAGCGTHSR